MLSCTRMSGASPMAVSSVTASHGCVTSRVGIGIPIRMGGCRRDLGSVTVTSSEDVAARLDAMLREVTRLRAEIASLRNLTARLADEVADLRAIVGKA